MLHIRDSLVDQFPPLLAIGGLKHAFVTRDLSVPEALTTDRAAALRALTPTHSHVCQQLGFSWAELVTAEQVHGDAVAIAGVNDTRRLPNPIPGADGLITQGPGAVLGIHVADCAAVSLVDPEHRVIGLVHSGKAGSELGIVGKAIAVMKKSFGSKPRNIIVHLGPCIRPPCYEIDIPNLIRSGALEAGILSINYHDCGICTAEQLKRYYSYRMEKGATGRMLALLGWEN